MPSKLSRREWLLSLPAVPLLWLRLRHKSVRLYSEPIGMLGPHGLGSTWVQEFAPNFEVWALKTGDELPHRVRVDNLEPGDGLFGDYWLPAQSPPERGSVIDYTLLSVIKRVELQASAPSVGGLLEKMLKE
jgi:hypothetical protein